MRKQKNRDTLVEAIERRLDLGEFVSYNESWDFINGLEEVKARIDTLVEKGEAERAVGLYETFLSGCYDKAEEIDDSGGNLGMFFEDLFCSWVRARQEAGGEAKETVEQVLRWMENDDYGLCYNIEEDVARILNKECFQLFKKHFVDQFEGALSRSESEEHKCIFDYPYEVRHPVDVLKRIYFEKKDLRSYLALCEKTPPTPEDCENIAQLCEAKGRLDEAMAWAERGLALEKERRWAMGSSHALTNIRQELLSKLGRGEEALESAWSEFGKAPSEYTYAKLMKYVPNKDHQNWHKKAMQEAAKTSLSGFIGICQEAKEWDTLAERIHSVQHEELEALSHYTTEEAAKKLSKEHGLAAARIYRALGVRILKAGKSKYYEAALGHFEKAKNLYDKNGRQQLWLEIVEYVRAEHSRKYGFMPDFEELVSGRGPEPRESFEEKAQRRWQRQTSG